MGRRGALNTPCTVMLIIIFKDMTKLNYGRQGLNFVLAEANKSDRDFRGETSDE